MKFNIVGKNVEITQAIEEYVENRLSHLSKYFVIDEDTNVRVLIRVYDDAQKIETTIPTKNGILRAEASDRDLYVAIDEIVTKLTSQIRKQKTKLKKQRSVKNDGYAFDFTYLEELYDVEDDNDEVVRSKVINPEFQDLDTAILKMEMLN
ncbi:MAG: ribosome hibernation-promoting factor, HPF/YfiA family, partial [Bacilli bacterium]